MRPSSHSGSDETSVRGQLSSRTTDSCCMSQLNQSYTNSQTINTECENLKKQTMIESGSKNTNGLFDRFIKNYSSSSSILDEPDLSFVSSQSNVNSPPKVNNFSLEKTMDNSSLIQFQQRQLSQQFANMSPIDQRLENELNSKYDETRFGTMINHSDMQSTKLTAVCQDLTKSLVLYSPKKYAIIFTLNLIFIYILKTGVLRNKISGERYILCRIAIIKLYMV